MAGDFTNNPKSDIEIANLFSDFLNKNFYPSLLKNIFQDTNFSFEKIANLDLQKSGIDEIIEYNSKRALVDEKVQLDYINENLPTNAFEILKQSGNSTLTNGWFIEKKLKTTHYIIFKDINLKNITKKWYMKTEEDIVNNFESLSFFIVNKEDLISFLKEEYAIDDIYLKLESKLLIEQINTFISENDIETINNQIREKRNDMNNKLKKGTKPRLSISVFEELNGNEFQKVVNLLVYENDLKSISNVHGRLVFANGKFNINIEKNDKKFKNFF